VLLLSFIVVLAIDNFGLLISKKHNLDSSINPNYFYSSPLNIKYGISLHTALEKIFSYPIPPNSLSTPL
jgi:hypothetical protein